MALSQYTALARIRDLIDEVADFERVYAATSDDAHALPGALNDFPSVVVVPGPTVEYILTQPQHRHTYEVKVLVFCNQAGDLGQSAAQAMALVVGIIEKFVGNVTLGGRVNSCRFERDSGMVTLEYAGIDYLGFEITLEVSEQSAANAAVGS